MLTRLEPVTRVEACVEQLLQQVQHVHVVGRNHCAVSLEHLLAPHLHWCCIWWNKEERKDMFYSTMHSTHFNTVILRQTIQIVREETICHHYMSYSFWLAARGFYMHHLTDRIAHTTAFVTPVMEHWLEWEIPQWVRQPITPWTNALTT